MDEPILALEGALGPFSVAISGKRPAAGVIDGRAALESGLGLIERLLSEGGLRLTDLGGIAVGTGPGGFTGLRIALSYAKALAFGAKLPLAGVSSFDILDAAAQAEGRLPRLTVVSGRPGIACIRRADRHGTDVACGPIAPTLARLLPEKLGELTVVGATEDVSNAVGERATSVLYLAGPEIPAVTLTRIACLRAPAASPHAVAPDYGELPAAVVRTKS